MYIPNLDMQKFDIDCGNKNETPCTPQWMQMFFLNIYYTTFRSLFEVNKIGSS